jgi:hypothetical protein
MGFLLMVRGHSLGQPFLSSRLPRQQAERHVDRVVQSVGIMLRKTKARAREVEKGHAFDR